LKAAIYVRVSTQQQTEKYSLDAQKRILSDYCDRHGYEYEIYEDAGISGETIEDRPAIKKLLADIPEDDYDIVLVIELERLSRSEELLDWLVIKKILRDNGVKLATSEQMLDFLTSGNSSRMTFHYQLITFPHTFLFAWRMRGAENPQRSKKIPKYSQLFQKAGGRENQIM